MDRHAKSIFFNFRPDNRIITFAPPSASISPFPVRFAVVNSTCLARNLIFYLRVALLVKPIYYRFVHTSSTHGPHIVHTWSTHKVHIKGYLSIYTLLGIFPMSKKLHVFEVPCHACYSPIFLEFNMGSLKHPQTSDHHHIMFVDQFGVTEHVSNVISIVRSPFWTPRLA